MRRGAQPGSDEGPGLEPPVGALPVVPVPDDVVAGKGLLIVLLRRSPLPGEELVVLSVPPLRPEVTHPLRESVDVP